MDGAQVVERAGARGGRSGPRDAPDAPGPGDASVGRGLAVRDVVVRYADPASGKGPGTTAVRGVSLDLAPGEVLALLGPSGCGKSSLLRAVAGLEPVAAGSVSWDGHDLAGVPVHRRGFGLMFQEGQLFPHRDVAGNVAFGLRMAGVRGAASRARVAELLDLVGLAGYAQRPVATLSGGERQRVALARALAPEPQLLLLDEPLSALDRGLRDRLAGDLRAALVATGTTALFVTHDHDEAFTVADRVAVMDAGRLLQVAAPEDLWRAPASRRVAEFLGYQAFVPLRAVPAELSERARGGVLAGSDSSAGAGALLAIGPTGLVLAAHVSEPASGGVLAGSDRSAGWTGTVVRSAFRRGRTEVTVDVDLGAGTQRVVALGSPSGGGAARAGSPSGGGVPPTPDGAAHHTFAPAPGERVRVVLDPAGCAVVPG
ncbi:ABC transporter ATP-binding protein [Oerskovia jenensis]|uniref:ABC transporter ATP-binding protein n=1 Tax=Oerskovia jenensis TaxID=162169 RepID=UPI0036DB33B7